MIKRILLIGLTFIFSLSIGCSYRSALSKADWETEGFEHYEYHYQQTIQLSGRDIEEIGDRLEYFYDFASDVWGFGDDRKITYYYFTSRDEVKRLAGIDMNGKVILEENIVLSIHGSDAHEVAHIFTTPTERPLRLANFWMEGIAMYYTWPKLYCSEGEERLYERPLGAWHGCSVHQNAKKLLEEKKLPKLESLIYGNEDFGYLDSDISYPAAGSYVTFLIGEAHSDLESVTKYREFINKANKADSTESVKSIFLEVFDTKFENTIIGWKEFLSGWDEEKLYEVKLK